MLFRLSAIQKNDMYDLMVTDRTIAERQNYGDKSFMLYALSFLYVFTINTVTKMSAIPKAT